MSSLTSIAIDVIKDLSGGRVSTDNKYSIRQVMEKIREARAHVIQDYLIKSKLRTIDPNWLQEYTPTFDKDLNSNTNKYVRFTIPKVLALPKNMGLFWVGKRDTLTNFLGSENPGTTSLYNTHRLTKPTDKYVTAQLLDGYIYLYGDRNIKNITVRAVFEDPTEVTGFDTDSTFYPVSAHMIPIIKEIVMKEMRLDLQIPRDTVNDAA